MKQNEHMHKVALEKCVLISIRAKDAAWQKRTKSVCDDEASEKKLQSKALSTDCTFSAIVL